MPVFDFECMQCNHTFEKIRYNGETIVCPECKSNTTRQLIGGPSFKVNGHNANNGYAKKPSLVDMVPK